jgi:hypothetical protein
MCLRAPDPNVDRFAPSQRGGYFGSDALCLEREADLIFQMVGQAHGLLLGPIGIHDDFLVDALLMDGIAFRFCYGSLRLKELTDTGEAQTNDGLTIESVVDGVAYQLRGRL